MSVLNTEIKPFTATAFKQGEFIEITEQDVLGKWAVFFFYPAPFFGRLYRKLSYRVFRQVFGVPAEQNVGTAAGHVSRYRNRP